jgi:parvulin-like peptidyl-prolyl isomerase
MNLRNLLFVTVCGTSCLLSCARDLPRTARIKTLESASGGGPSQPATAEVPELIEVRVLVVSHAGAQGASEKEPRTKEQALERARMIARMARSGDRFAELVRAYSDRPGAADDFGLFRLRPKQPSAFGQSVVDAALALAPGQIGDPVPGTEGIFVIERRPDPPGGPTRVSAKHILISFKGARQAIEGVTRDEAEARSLAEQVARKARAGEDWAMLASQYTDEPGSKGTGGDLGSFGRGQMVPSFEKAAFALQVGEISEVVASPFGFHVIQRYE